MSDESEFKWIGDIPGLDEANKTRIMGAHSRIRNLLGSSREDGTPILMETPLHGWISQPFLHAQLLVVEFADDLASLEECGNFEELVGRLRRKEHCRSAYYELRLASRFLKKGCAVEFISERGAKRKPDLRIDRDNDILMIEVHALGQSKEEKDIQSDLLTIARTTWGVPGVRLGGRIYKRLAYPTREEICELIRNKIVKGDRFEGHETVAIPNVAEIHLYSPGFEHEVPAEYQKGLKGAIPETTEPHRLRTSIMAKVKQLPEDQTGLLYVVDNNLWDHAFKTGFAAALTNELDQTVFVYPNLSAVVVYHFVWTGSPDINKTENGLGYSRRILTTGITDILRIREDTLLIPNKYARNPLYSWAREAMGFGRI